MFKSGNWQNAIDVRDFVLKNVTPYDGEGEFLCDASARTKHLWQLCLTAISEERANNGVLGIDNEVVSGITSHGPGYIDQEQELIVGLQTDQLLKRAMKPYGGIAVVEKACQEHGLEMSDRVKDIFNNYAKTHNDGVFDVYTPEIRLFRSLGILTGLPDNYARGRIIGDYRRVALYGTDRLIEAKKLDMLGLIGPMTDERIRLREEVAEQIKALGQLRELGAIYGLDLSRPAQSAQEAVQWVYLSYLAAVKEQDGAAMSLGNVSSFLDIYMEHDLQLGLIDENYAQELIDQFVMKLRMVRHLRMDAYNEIFAGDPTWVTEAIGGRLADGRHKVTKTSFRFLQTLYNLGPSPEPNMTILCPGIHRHFFHSVRERRLDAVHPQPRRLRHCLLCIFSGNRQTDSVFRGAYQPGQDPAPGHQRRALRNDRKASTPQHSRIKVRPPRFGGSHDQLPPGYERGGTGVQRRHEHHPLHARQVLLRESANGPGGYQSQGQPGLRGGGTQHRSRFFVGHQTRKSAGGA